MKQTAITAFSLAYAVGAAKHQQDGTLPPVVESQAMRLALAEHCRKQVNRVPVRNPAHPRHQRRIAGVSARQYSRAMRYVSRFYAAQGQPL
ncbi:hypothetical protein [Achromobacter mucicolens]|uniref:hypothetical protein n=1 Tax=Achromobacter mucicolens TaxID=1389922 RepID=UPI002FE08BC1